MSAINNNTTVASNITTGSSNWLLHLSLWSLRILCPLFIIICPIFNWACIRVFQSQIYARSSSKWYFIFIATFDTIYVLVTAPLLFLITLEIYILNWHILLCKSIVFLNYLSCQISAGLLACLSIDRLVATSCVSFYRHNCTTNLSKILCLAVIFVFSILNSHYLVGYTIDSHGYCSIRHYRWYEEIYSRLNVVYLLSYSIIPFTIITICNIFIVISVCQNKTNMKKKYDRKNSINLSSINHEQTVKPKAASKNCDKTVQKLKFEQSSTADTITNENEHEILVTMKNEKVINNLIGSKLNWQCNRSDDLSDKSLLNAKERTNSIETQLSSSPSVKKQVSLRLSGERPLVSSTFSSPTNSQKMSMQLQITISLLVVSICFILCALPNCITTIMIQTYTNDEHVRKFWQAMNYFSIVPLLTTHSVNLIFYYLSSNMFRERFKQYYFKKRP
ncbi:unnamed protein product [Rotaria magnacalcarata]|uniref:G-protein coupled receptors family 1 profile domain-containing protein n=1 Tax=Rotaria magnacalcarata TaxID=392030 RepID=A0A816NGU8_9BILA|nr:unnamed protein product [Rotaria magnacalcarata]CAF1643029.1 unnamed protein product [Rotaria magnacalcarata]CAF2034919.1 unnamed protein product [Rotaria magnacalcarata]CAF2112348.1 unnamed protein product [Rotaria magnacalcarata]CAF3873893.1 unnamed protein product [Rotaria magnacalcarata]